MSMRPVPLPVQCPCAYMYTHHRAHMARFRLGAGGCGGRGGWLQETLPSTCICHDGFAAVQCTGPPVAVPERAAAEAASSCMRTWCLAMASYIVSYIDICSSGGRAVVAH